MTWQLHVNHIPTNVQRVGPFRNQVSIWVLQEVLLDRFQRAIVAKLGVGFTSFNALSKLGGIFSRLGTDFIQPCLWRLVASLFKCRYQFSQD